MHASLAFPRRSRHQVLTKVSWEGMASDLLLCLAANPATQLRELRQHLSGGQELVTVPFPPRPGVKGTKEAHNQRIRVEMISNQIEELPVGKSQTSEVPFPTRGAHPLGHIGHPKPMFPPVFFYPSYINQGLPLEVTPISVKYQRQPA